MKHRIYADNAATTMLCSAASKEMARYLARRGGNPSGLYLEGRIAKEELEGARTKIACCIGANPSEIIFTSGGTEADNAAIYTAAEHGAKYGKHHIVASPIEHHAVLKALDALSEQGFDVEYLPVKASGIVNPRDVWSAIRGNTCLVTVMAANNEIGTIQPITEIGKICRKKHVLFHTDAVQAVGHIPFYVEDMCVDFLAASGHKFGAPTGVGFLYARSKSVDSVFPMTVGGSQERGRRAGTENVLGAVGMAAALEDSMLPTYQHTKMMRERLIDGILTIPGAKLNGDRVNRLPGNANICFDGVAGEPLVLLLDEMGIAASSGSACTTGEHAGSYVLKAIGRSDAEARSALRLTISEDTTVDDVDEIIRAVTICVSRLRLIGK